MKELSIFIDESGDFGEYDHHSPWYIVTMVFHEQDISIQESMEYLNRGVDKKLWYICLLFLLIVIIYYISTG
ncbi:DUF3800 domain-containing protein, partial [Lachnospiraceae bacterium 48-42]